MPAQTPMFVPEGRSEWRGAKCVAFALLAMLLVISAGAYCQIFHKSLTFPLAAALFLGVASTVGIITVRHQIRIARIRLIEIFARNFGFSSRLTPLNPPSTPAEKAADTTRADPNISFEFVKAKYYVDLPERPRTSNPDQQPSGQLDTGDVVVPLAPFAVSSDWLLLASAIPMMAFAFAGSFILFAPYEALRGTGVVGKWLWPSLLAAGGTTDKEWYGPGASSIDDYHRQLLLIAALAFAGAFVYSLRLLLRAVSVFDLNAVTFLRSFVHMVLSTILAVVIWRVMNETNGPVAAVWNGISEVVQGVAKFVGLSATAGPADTRNLSSVWYAFAFAIGFVPDAGLVWILQRCKLEFKRRLTDYDDDSAIIPLTMLDGIDFFTAFRLEEANIFDVQNLATANPIMLHIETPFGIYQAIDWVAQAQLCTLIGPERFLFLKRFCIRTIFDLERAVLDKNAKSALPKLIMYALFAEDKKRKALEEKLGILKFPRSAWMAGAPAAAGTTAGAAVPPVDPPPASPNFTLDEAWPFWLNDDYAKELVAIMVDDLHVRRLRQVWNHIVDRLGKDTNELLIPR